MSNIADKQTVLEQYKNDQNLSARINLHQYNINKVDWNLWCFERMAFQEDEKILELGCGNGLLWQKNSHRLMESWHIVLSDFSEGMLESARQNLSNTSKDIAFQIIDIQDIPYANNSFDAVIARHMLYHVPDLRKALSEVKRVLTRNGVFYATTNGTEHLQELAHLIREFDSTITFNTAAYAERFGLENGESLLNHYFDNITCNVSEGQIVVKEAEPVVAYATSSLSVKRALDEPGKREAFKQYIEAYIHKHGEIRITTKGCLFTARI